MSNQPPTERIAQLNDAARQNKLKGATIVIASSALASLQDATGAAETISSQIAILRALKSWEPPANDAHGERDFGILDVLGIRLFFKIDYYDLNMEYHSEDAANDSLTRRVVTVMLPENY